MLLLPFDSSLCWYPHLSSGNDCYYDTVTTANPTPTNTAVTSKTGTAPPTTTSAGKSTSFVSAFDEPDPALSTLQ